MADMSDTRGVFRVGPGVCDYENPSKIMDLPSPVRVRITCTQGANMCYLPDFGGRFVLHPGCSVDVVTKRLDLGPNPNNSPAEGWYEVFPL